MVFQHFLCDRFSHNSVLKVLVVSVILLRPKIGYAPQKYDVISMPRQHYTNTKHIPIESYHPVVSIMLRYMDPKIKHSVKICVDTKWKATRQRKAWHPLAGGQSWPWNLTSWSQNQ